MRAASTSITYDIEAYDEPGQMAEVREEGQKLVM